MTSKISFSKMVRSELHQMNWLTAVWALLFGLLIPFRVLMVMAVNASRGYGNMVKTPLEIFCGQVGLGHPENTVFILLAGAACALCAFSYLHSAVKQDMYHSLALRRERLFAVRYLSSVLTFAIAYLLSQLLAVLIGVFYGAMTPRLLFEIVLASVQGMLHFLCSYSAVLLAIMLTGKILTTVFAVGVFGGYIPFLYILQVGMRSVFFETGLDGSYGLEDYAILKCSSPWAFCLFQPLQGKKIGVTGYVPTAGELCQLLALAAVLTMLALLLYRIRRTEAAGSALAFRKTEGTVKLLLSVPTAAAAALVAYELFDSVIWETVFIVLFGTLACLIMEFIYRWDIRQVLQKKKYIATTVVLTAVLFFAFRFDVIGYNTYLPAKEDVAAMSVYDTHFFIHYPEVTGDDTYSRENTVKLLDYFETEDFELLYKMAESGVEHAKDRHEDLTGVTVYIMMKYRTQGGKEIYRGYYVDEELYLNAMDEMMKRPEFKKKYFPILNWEEPAIAALQASANVTVTDADWVGNGGTDDDDYNYDYDYEDEYDGEGMYTEYADSSAESSTYIDIPSSRIKDVIEAYCSDLETISWRDIWLSRSYLCFVKDQVSWKNDMYPISDAFENTLKELKDIQEM